MRSVEKEESVEPVSRESAACGSLKKLEEGMQPVPVKSRDQY